MADAASPHVVLPPENLDNPEAGLEEGTRGSRASSRASTPGLRRGLSAGTESIRRSFSQSKISRNLTFAAFVAKPLIRAPSGPQHAAQATWKNVLTQLQTEKSRTRARKEEAYMNRALFCLPPTSRLREKMIKLEQWGPLNNFILVAIVVNCIFLTFEDPVCKCAAGASQDQCTQNELFKRMLYVGANWRRQSALDLGGFDKPHDFALECSFQEETENVLWIGEIVFTIIFLLEMMIKVVARGFILHTHAYLRVKKETLDRDLLNWLDFVVVVAGTVSVTMEILKLPKSSVTQFLRVMRVLRPLRTMTRLPGMKPLIKTLGKAVASLTNVVLLLIFGFVLFGIFGLDVLKGGLRGRCFVDPEKNNFTKGTYSRLISQQTPFLVEASSDSICAPDDWVFDKGNFLGGTGCDNVWIDHVEYNVTCSRKKWCHGQKTTNTTMSEAWYRCKYDYNSNPFDLGAGWFSYDNFLGAVLTIFQCLTNEGWVDFMYGFGDGVSLWGSRIFHLCWVVLGSMIIVQLVLGSLSLSYDQAQDEEEHAREREALDIDAILMEWDRIDTDNAKFQSGVIERAPSAQKMNTGLESEQKERNDQRTFRVSDKGDFVASQQNTEQKDGDEGPQGISLVWSTMRRASKVLIHWWGFPHFITFAIIVNTINMMIFTWHHQPYFESSICKRLCALDPHLPVDAMADCAAPAGLFNHTYDLSESGNTTYRPKQDKFCFLKNDAEKSYATFSKFKGTNCSRHNSKLECNQNELHGCWWVSGSCQRALYNSHNFASLASLSIQENSLQGFGFTLSGEAKIMSLRHICGQTPHEIEEYCPSYDPDLMSMSQAINLVLTWIFIVECGLKLVGDGFKDYFADSFNRLDFAIVVSSIIALSQVSELDVSIFRTLRLTRMLKLMRSMTEVQKILKALISALVAMYPLLIVLLIFIFMMSALMISINGNMFRMVKSDWPRSNFDSFFMSERGHGAFFTVFQMLTTENWNTIMYNSIRTSGQEGSIWHEALGSAFPNILIVLIGNYIFINLFISILLEGFDDDETNEEVPKNTLSVSTSASKFLKFIRKHSSFHTGKIAPETKIGAAQQDTDKVEEEVGESDGEDDGHTEVNGYFGSSVTVPRANSCFLFATTNPVRILSASVVEHPFFDKAILACILFTSALLLFERPEWSVVQASCDRGGCGSENSPACCSQASLYDTFAAMDQLFSIVFLTEMTLKILVFGFILHPGSYLRNSWNVLDGIISVMGMMSAFGDGAFKFMKVLRVVRALRPLRVVRRHPNLRVAVLGLISAIPAIISVMPLLMFWYAMWAMLGVSTFKGMMYSCYNPNDQTFVGVAESQGGPQWAPSATLSGPDSVPTIIECVTSGQGNAVWKSKPYSFDGFWAALLTLWEMSTTEGWMDVMAALSDSPIAFPGVTPIPNLNPFWPTMYSVVHIFFGSFIFMNVIVSKVINNYMKVKTENSGESMFMTAEQKEWKQTRLMISKLSPMQRVQGPENPLRRRLFDLCNEPNFDSFITVCILLNILTMMFNSLEYEEIECFLASMFWVNVVFTVIFFSEMIIKMAGLGVRWYFVDAWNKLDFAIVLCSLVILALDILAKEYDCSPPDTALSQLGFLRIFRALRILRVLRLIRRLKELKAMLTTFYISMPAVVNFGMLTILVLLIFSVLGVWLFWNVNLHQDAGEFMDEYVTYSKFDSAFFSLFRQTTGEAWNGIMYYCAETDPYLACADTSEFARADGCAQGLMGILYHVAWNLFGCYALMQLFTAVILENFMDVMTGESQIIDQDKLNEFVTVWTRLDPEATHEISVDDLPKLIQNLSPPLGLKFKPVTPALMMEVVKDLRIPIKNKKVGYKPTFLAFVKRIIEMQKGTKLEPDDAQDEKGQDGGAESENLGPKSSQVQARQSVSPRTKGPLLRAFIDSAESSWQASATVAEDFAARAVQKTFREWREVRVQFKKGMVWRATLDGDNVDDSMDDDTG